MKLWEQDQHSTSNPAQQRWTRSSAVLHLCFFGFDNPKISYRLLFPRLWFRKDSTCTRWYAWEQSCCGQWRTSPRRGAAQDPDRGCPRVHCARYTAHPLTPQSNSVGRLRGWVHLSRVPKRKPVLLLICYLFWVLLWLDMEKNPDKTKATWSLRCL